jgi:hypothetical protein
VLTVGLDNAFLFAAMAAEAAVVGLLLYKHAWRTLPVFFIYVAWELTGDVVGSYIMQRHTTGLSSDTYLISFLVMQILDSILQFAVLIEVGWSILRPLRSRLSSRGLILVVLLIVVLGAVIWPFADIHGVAKLSAAYRNIIHLQQTTSILRVLFFVLLAGCSQLLSIGWRDRELQIATGLGFFSLVSLAADILRQHMGMTENFNVLNRLVSVGYICSLFYWVFSFTQKEAEPREFTPQMQNFLLAVAGTARSGRIEITDAIRRNDRNRPK